MLRSLRIISAGISCLFPVLLTAQDQHFTQFFASPLTLNPALSGTFDGGYRLATIYRDQGRSYLDEPYTTFSGAVDLRFGINSMKKNKKDALGTGVIFYSDRSASVNFYTNQIAITAAYHKALNQDGNHFLSAGFQFGISQRNVNYDNFSFQDQFNGGNGYTNPTGEYLPENNFSFGDYAFGLNYVYSPSRRPGIFAGFAMHHLLEPQISFYANEQIEELKQEDYLHRKMSAHLSFVLPWGNTFQFSPRVLAYMQGPHLAANAGGNFRFLINDTKGYALHTGGWVRGVRSEEKTFGLDAAVAMFGVEYNNFLIGLSYDVGLSSLNRSGTKSGALEISIAFLGNYNNETILCPKF